MNVNNRILGKLVFLIFISVIAMGTQCNKKTFDPDLSESTIQFTGMVVWVEEGDDHFWGIIRDVNNAKYRPSNLPPECQKRGLHVRLICNPVFNQMAVTQWGRAITIVSIEILDDEAEQNSSK
jgi:hypothetical protein